MAKRKTNGHLALHPEIALDLMKTDVVNPYNIGPVYANNAAILMGQHDLRVIFSEVVSFSPTQPPRVEMRANVTMAPTHFKALVQAVTQSLEMYEKRFGEITWPPKNQ
jgi:hypothetical protein